MQPTFAGERARPASAAPPMGSPARPFGLLRWFSIASLVAMLPVAAATGMIMSHVVAEQTLERDALLTAQFIRNCLFVESRSVGAAGLSAYLDARADAGAAGVDAGEIAHARAEVFEHLETLPDSLLTTVYARDRMVIWSTNKALIGTYAREDEELEEAFAARHDVARHHSGSYSVRHDAQFVVPPKDFFVENYVPLLDTRGEVAAVVEVYKEPADLMSSIRTGQALVWTTTLVGGVLVYLGMFGIIRRAGSLLRQQQHQLVEAESQMFVGDMATALAHSFRTPLTTVRSSAEGVLSSTDAQARQNAQDIITRVDFLSHWIGELLLYSRPLAGKAEAVDLQAVLDEVLASFGPSLARLGIRVTWNREASAQALVQGNTSLFRQAMHSVISNAVEAMPAGGEMRIEVRRTSDRPGIEVSVSDTGIGMSPQQVATAFRPFHTTKSHGLGVGLPMVQRALQRFGGLVTLASEENAGTHVRLRFRT